ncbi:hypothetical protein [Dactylosporangium sp. CS-033363]|uniref:hypothetical protein n=1 Tax=Dactylosporangium sp. CS-033363 TaxID=3239935 RepID=UPI003D926026
MKKAELFSALKTEMQALGFKRYKSNFEFHLDLGAGIEGSCAFADSNHGRPGALFVATIVGVRLAAVEDRVAAWCGDVVPGWDGYYVPTVAMNTGYLTAERQWQEHPIDLAAESPVSVVGPILADVKDIALPFLRSHASYAGVLDVLRTGQGLTGGLPIERLPLLHALVGDLDAAYEALEDMRRQIEDGSGFPFRNMPYIEGFEAEFPMG